MTFIRDLLRVFTQEKSFRKNRFIGSRLLNRMGFHVLRIVAARGVMAVRWALLSPLMPRDQRQHYHRDGYCAIEGFVDADALVAIRQEIRDDCATDKLLIEGDTLIQRSILDPVYLQDKPALRALVESKPFLNAIAYTSGNFTRRLVCLERMRHRALESDAEDPQKTLHSDTFHPTMKAWLFLEDVRLEDGPFHYVPGSNRLTRRRLRWEYRKSLVAADMRDGHSEDGSFRALEEDLSELDLPAPKPMTVKAGTFVIANTNGFHCRGQAEDGGTRLELWISGRNNPFNPFPGIAMPGLHRRKSSRMKALWAGKTPPESIADLPPLSAR